MPPLQLLIKPVSGTCNMRCGYCFYCDEMEKRRTPNFGIMSIDTLEQIVRETLKESDACCGFTFQGGEPTLAGIDFYQNLLRFQACHNEKNVKIINAIQTNGYGITEDWAQFLSENHILVGVSLDGVKYTHNAYRKSVSGEDTFGRVMKGIEYLENHNAEFNILTVVNDRTARLVSRIYSFYKKHGWKYLQFIPCLDPLQDIPGQRDYSLNPELYGAFLCELFELWYIDLEKGEQPYIRLFENYIAILMGYPAEACDQRGCCSVQYVTEADGSVYPCDFYVTEEYFLGRFGEDTLREMEERGASLGFDGQEREDLKACGSCEYFWLCRGGCKRHWSQGQNHFCPAFRTFFRTCLPRMKMIAARLSMGQR